MTPSPVHRKNSPKDDALQNGGFFLKNEKKTIVMVFKIHPVRTDIILSELGRWTLKTHFLHQGLFFTSPLSCLFISHLGASSFPPFLGEVGAATGGLQEELGFLSPFAPALATCRSLCSPGSAGARTQGVLVPAPAKCPLLSLTGPRE